MNFQHLNLISASFYCGGMPRSMYMHWWF